MIRTLILGAAGFIVGYSIAKQKVPKGLLEWVILIGALLIIIF